MLVLKSNNIISCPHDEKILFKDLINIISEAASQFNSSVSKLKGQQPLDGILKTCGSFPL